MSNDWRFLKSSRVSTAHLWQAIQPTSLPVWYKTRCSLLAVDDLFLDTHPLTGDSSPIRKCKKCVSFETRCKESA